MTLHFNYSSLARLNKLAAGYSKFHTQDWTPQELTQALDAQSLAVHWLVEDIHKLRTRLALAEQAIRGSHEQ